MNRPAIGSLTLITLGLILATAAASKDETLERLAPYKQWTKVTQQPSSSLNTLALAVGG
jgi:hypothetical protein